MKTIKQLLLSLLAVFFILTNCQQDDYQLGDLVTPTNIELVADIVGADALNPNGDGSGSVNFTTTATNAISLHIVVQNITKIAIGGALSHDFTELGLVTYPVTVIAYGTGGVSTTKTFDIQVISSYAPPAELITALTGDSSKSWRVAGELPEHFGLGPVGGSAFGEFYPNGSDQTDAKADAGVYDDRYIFNTDGTFTHITNGGVFGREGLIDELGGSGGTPDGADLWEYSYPDYTAQWTLSAPGGTETLSLTSIGFIGYYTGGDHKYEVISRSDSEIVLRTTDGNGEFDWWFRLVPE